MAFTLLKGHYPEETVQTAIEYNPAYAGIDKQKISRRAYEVIQRETKKVSGISFAPDPGISRSHV